MRNLRGRNNPNWNGGVSTYLHHTVLKKNRIAVLTSVNYKCESCGGTATQVHHRDNNRNNHALENLMPICIHCHGKIPRDGAKGRPGKPHTETKMSLEELEDYEKQGGPVYPNGCVKFSISLRTETGAILDTLAKDGGRTRSGQVEYIIRQWLKLSNNGRRTA